MAVFLGAELRKGRELKVVRCAQAVKGNDVRFAYEKTVTRLSRAERSTSEDFQ